MGKKFLAKLLAAAMLAGTVFMGAPAASVQAAQQAYYFSNMSYAGQWGVYERSIENGALKASFYTQYGEVKYTLPTAIPVSSIDSMTVGANTSGQNTAFKFYDANGKELFVKYNANCYSYNDFPIDVSGSGEIKAIGVMSQSTAVYTATVYNIKVNTKPASGDDSETGQSTLKSALGETFGKVGTAVTLSDLKDTSKLNLVRNDFNSITMENEMKPDAILGYQPNLVSTEQAKAYGIIIPDGYAEDTVPMLDYSNIDEALKLAYDNGLSVRMHTLIWHQQTPSWFFKYEYNSGYDYCNSYTMDRRVEYYVKNVIAHISTSEYKDVVYAYDIANEYFHNTDTGSSSHWTNVYGEEGTRPSYIKKAFTYANDMLNYYELRDQVSLFYNDYNTYLVADDIVALTQFINEDGKKCDGVGMQSHLDVDWPDAGFIGQTIDKFQAAGLEIQITELDATINTRKTSYTLQDQADYYYSIIKMLKEKKQGGANITGVTFWGISDDASWRVSGQPLLFSKPGVKKPAYDAVINAMK